MPTFKINIESHLDLTHMVDVVMQIQIKSFLHVGSPTLSNRSTFCVGLNCYGEDAWFKFKRKKMGRVYRVSFPLTGSDPKLVYGLCGDVNQP